MEHVARLELEPADLVSAAATWDDTEARGDVPVEARDAETVLPEELGVLKEREIVQDGVVALEELLCEDTLPALSTADSLYEYVVDAARPVSEVDFAGAYTCFQYDPFR